MFDSWNHIISTETTIIKYKDRFVETYVRTRVERKEIELVTLSEWG